MHWQDFFTYYPSRLLWMGGAMISGLGILSGFILLPMADQPVFPLPSKKNVKMAEVQTIPSFALDKGNEKPCWDLALIENELVISLSPPRPDILNAKPIAHVRAKGTLQSRRIPLPGRVNLAFNDRGALRLLDGEGDFWVDLSLGDNKQITAQVSILEEGEAWKRQFNRIPDEPPLQRSDEFPVGSAVRTLGEASWLGADVVAPLGLQGVKQRIEIGSTVLMLDEKDWICWKEDKWFKVKNVCEAVGMAAARLRAVGSQTLEWDVWDESGKAYTRLALPLQIPPAGRSKPEELFSSVRIRSDKQVSCMIEKQSLILRVGDWVLKENGRWRSLKKQEDRQALLTGKKMGELFVLDKIDSKTRLVKGRLFYSNRIQSTPVELTASCMKRERTKQRTARTGRSG